MLRDNKKILAGNFWTVTHWVVSNFLRFLVRKGVYAIVIIKNRHCLCTYSIKVILRFFCLQHKQWLKGTNGCNGFVLLRIFTEFLPRVFFQHFLEGTESILKWSRKWPWDPCFRRGAKQTVGCSVVKVGKASGTLSSAAREIVPLQSRDRELERKKQMWETGPSK